MDITYRPARCEDLEDAERIVQVAGNELRVRHGRQPWPAPPPIAFPKFCLAEDPDGLWVADVVMQAVLALGFRIGEPYVLMAS